MSADLDAIELQLSRFPQIIMQFSARGTWNDDYFGPFYRQPPEWTLV